MRSANHISREIFCEFIEEAIEEGTVSFAELRCSGIFLSIQIPSEENRIEVNFSDKQNIRPHPQTSFQDTATTTPRKFLKKHRHENKDDTGFCYILQLTAKDPLDNPKSAEFFQLLHKCRVFFRNFKLKQLPRNCGKNPKRAVSFTENTLIPKLVELYGSLQFFQYCWGRTEAGHSLLEEWIQQSSFISQSKLEAAISLGHRQMVDALQEHYNLSGEYVKQFQFQDCCA